MSPIFDESVNMNNEWKKRIWNTLALLPSKPYFAETILNWNWQDEELRMFVGEFLAKEHIAGRQHLYIDIDFIPIEVENEITQQIYNKMDEIRSSEMMEVE
jgi:hypothetical protein